MFEFGNGWDALLAPEADKDYYKQLRLFSKVNTLNQVYPFIHR